MCNRCAFAGCRHDWQRWTPREYDDGYSAGFHGLASLITEAKSPADSGYLAGYEAGQSDRERQEKRETAQ